MTNSRENNSFVDLQSSCRRISRLPQTLRIWCREAFCILRDKQ